MQILDTALHQAHSKHAENAASPQLWQAANEFEANFLEELLKPLSEDSMFGSGTDAGSSMGTVSSMASQALADGIAKDGGLGIARRVLADLAPIEAKSNKNGSASDKKCGGCAQHLQLAAQDSPAAASIGTPPQNKLSIPRQFLPIESTEPSSNGEDQRSSPAVSVGPASITDHHAREMH